MLGEISVGIDIQEEMSTFRQRKPAFRFCIDKHNRKGCGSSNSLFALQEVPYLNEGLSQKKPTANILMKTAS